MLLAHATAMAQNSRGFGGGDRRRCAVLRELLPPVNGPILNSLFGWAADAPSADQVGQRLAVPAATRSPSTPSSRARACCSRRPEATCWSSLPREGKVVLLARDRNDDGRPDAIRDLLTGRSRPHGLALSEDGWLYVGEADSVARVRFDVAAGELAGTPETIVTGLPEGGNHWSRSVGIGPDGRLYVTVARAATCARRRTRSARRCCASPRTAPAMSSTPGACAMRSISPGSRAPGTCSRRTTAGPPGRRLPPCELNRIVPGGDYGWPVANGDRIPDPDLGAGQQGRIAASIPPAFAFNPHNAPLGIEFLTHPALPAADRGKALVALHGSWNRRVKDGYKVVALRWDDDGRIRSEDFVTGFLAGDEVTGRPVDVVEAPNSGTIFVSDDYAGVVYAIRRAGARAAGAGARRAHRRPGAGRPVRERPGRGARRARAQGEAHWNANGCAGCHVAEGAAPGMVTQPLAGLAARYDVPALSAFFEAPTPPMPARR